MTDDIDRRTQEREAALLAALSTMRRMCAPTDYVYDKAQEAFWDTVDGTLHSKEAVDASIPIERWRVVVEEAQDDEPGAPRRGRPRRPRERLIPPSRDIMRVESDQFVEGSTWWPGRERVIRDWFVGADGYYEAPGRRIMNTYRAPPELVGEPDKAHPWVEHVMRLWPDKREHGYFFDYCAHMLQHPEIKCNAAIVLSGAPGIGKDAALYPIKAAVGQWNCKGIEPDDLFSQFKPWLQTLMLVVDEVRPTKDEFHASSMYNILKPMIAAPPDTLPLNNKYERLRHVINVMRVFITTNDWLSMYIPPEDRRMFIMHSTIPQKWHEAAGNPGYFDQLFGFFDSGGIGHVAAWLRARSLTHFKPKAQVERTAGWQAVANTWGEPEDAIAHALDQLGSPDIVLGAELAAVQFDGAEDIAGMLKSPRKIGHRMQRAGYVMVGPTNGGRWVFRANGHVLRARMAFVKQGAVQESAALQAAIAAHGATVAAKATGGKL